MIGKQGNSQHDYSREAFLDLNPKNPESQGGGGAVEVAHSRLSTIDIGINNLARIVSQSPEVQAYAKQQEAQPYSPAVEAEAIARQAAEQEQQAAMGANAREQLQSMPDTSPALHDAAVHTTPMPATEVLNHVTYISQIADQRYNGNLPGMN